MRRFVIGDVHGCSKALRTIVETISPTTEDLIVFLGDFIDRGPDSRGVVDLVLSLSQATRVIAIRGNHELMLMDVLIRGCSPDLWLQGGGAATLVSYGGSLERIPASHIEFFASLRAHFETDNELFIHAGYQPDVPAERIDDAHRYWNHLTGVLAPHCSGKRVFVGHTPQASFKIRDFGHLVLMDTYCFGGGWLTAMNLDTNEIIQANSHGHLRRDWASTMRNLFSHWLSNRRRSKLPVDNGSRFASPATDSVKQDWRRSIVATRGSAP